MNSRLSSPFFRAALLGCALLLPGFAVHADTVKLKSGESLDGKITYEGSDFIKLEIPISPSIKETKTIVRTDIAEIIKAAPDDVAFNELQKQLPAPSLMGAESYRSLIDKGPKAFLAQFPASQHKPAVEKILADLSDELDKVERGNLKIEGEWISALERQQFETLTNSRIRQVVFNQKLAQGDLFGALREFDVLEKQFYGTPAYAAAISEVKKVLPAFGQQLQRALADVAYRNQKWEEDKALLDEVARQQVEAARERELANYTKAIEREKAAGMKWLSINQNSDQSLAATIQLIRTEIERINGMDEAGLAKLAEDLVAADKMIAEGKLVEAKVAIKAATAGLSGTQKSSGSSSKSRSGAPAKTSYAAALTAKIVDSEKALAEAKKQAENASLGDKASQVIKAGEAAVVAALTPDAPPPSVGAETGAEGAETAPASKVDQGSVLTELMASGAKKSPTPAPADSAKKSPTKKTSSSSSKKAVDSDDDEDTGSKPEPVVADIDEGGGFNIQYVIWGVTGLLVLIVVILKATGAGGKKAQG